MNGTQLAALDQRQQRAPLLLRQVRAGGVVTGSVQQHHGARRQALERGRHGLELHPAGRRVEVRIRLELEPAPGQERHVVRPGGRAHVHHRVAARRGGSARRRDAARRSRPGTARCARGRPLSAACCAPNTMRSIAWLKPALPVGPDVGLGGLRGHAARSRPRAPRAAPACCPDRRDRCRCRDRPCAGRYRRGTAAMRPRIGSAAMASRRSNMR